MHLTAAFLLKQAGMVMCTYACCSSSHTFMVVFFYVVYFCLVFFASVQIVRYVPQTQALLPASVSETALEAHAVLAAFVPKTLPSCVAETFTSYLNPPPWVNPRTFYPYSVFSVDYEGTTTAIVDLASEEEVVVGMDNETDTITNNNNMAIVATQVKGIICTCVKEVYLKMLTFFCCCLDEPAVSQEEYDWSIASWNNFLIMHIAAGVIGCLMLNLYETICTKEIEFSTLNSKFLEMTRYVMSVCLTYY